MLPSLVPSLKPSTSSVPSLEPSLEPSTSLLPSLKPSTSLVPSLVPSLSSQPTTCDASCASDPHDCQCSSVMIGCGSCSGIGACVFTSGTIGSIGCQDCASCIGTRACEGQTGTIGIKSCIGFSSCNLQSGIPTGLGDTTTIGNESWYVVCESNIGYFEIIQNPASFSLSFLHINYHYILLQ